MRRLGAGRCAFAVGLGCASTAVWGCTYPACGMVCYYVFIKQFKYVLLDLVTPQTKFGVNPVHVAEVMVPYAPFLSYLLPEKKMKKVRAIAPY